MSNSDPLPIWTTCNRSFFAFSTRADLPQLLSEYSLLSVLVNDGIRGYPDNQIVILEAQKQSPSIWINQNYGTRRPLRPVKIEEAIAFAECEAQKMAQADEIKLTVQRVIEDSLKRRWYGAIAESGEEVAVFPDVAISSKGLVATFTSYYRHMPGIALVSRSVTASTDVLDLIGYETVSA